MRRARPRAAARKAQLPAAATEQPEQESDGKPPTAAEYRKVCERLEREETRVLRVQGIIRCAQRTIDAARDQGGCEVDNILIDATFALEAAATP